VQAPEFIAVAVEAFRIDRTGRRIGSDCSVFPNLRRCAISGRFVSSGSAIGGGGGGSSGVGCSGG